MSQSEDRLVITGVVRTEFGKGAARRLRRAAQTPAVLYGHGLDPVHLALPAHALFLAVKGSANAVLHLTVDGEESLALVKDVQRDPVSRIIEHVDLLAVRKGEKVTVEVPVVTEGESFPGTMVAVDLQNITLEASATAIPESFVVSVAGLGDGTVLRVADLELPRGVQTDLDPETVVLTVSIPQEELPAEESAEGAEEAAE